MAAEAAPAVVHGAAPSEAPPRAIAGAAEASGAASAPAAAGARVIRFVVADELGGGPGAAVQIMALRESAVVWIAPLGRGRATLPHLVMGAVGRFDNGAPLASTVAEFGSGDAQEAHGTAKRLAKRTGRVVHVTCSLPSSSLELLQAVERRIVQELADAEAAAPNAAA